MKIFHTIEETQGRFTRPVVTVGSFDGVHAGHRRILSLMKETASRVGGETVLVTFDPHPRQALYPYDDSLKLLSSTEEKMLLIEQAGIDNLIVLPFTEAVGEMTSAEFAHKYLLETIGAHSLIIGYNHHFGKNREGNQESLKELHGEFEFELIEVPRFDVGVEKVSSTVVRQAIESGDMATASRLLGQPYGAIGRLEADGKFYHPENTKLFPETGTYPVTVKGPDGNRVQAVMDFPARRIVFPSWAEGEKLMGTPVTITFD